jgi:hypothetical protein
VRACDRGAAEQIGPGAIRLVPERVVRAPPASDRRNRQAFIRLSRIVTSNCHTAFARV